MHSDVSFFWPDINSSQDRKKLYISVLMEVSRGTRNLYTDIFLFVFACRFFEYFVILDEIRESSGEPIRVRLTLQIRYQITLKQYTLYSAFVCRSASIKVVLSVRHNTVIHTASMNLDKVIVWLIVCRYR